jgi:CBS domain-containing protein
VLTDHDNITRCVPRGHDVRDSVRLCATSDDLATVSLDAEAADVLALMERRSLRRLPVLDADGRVAGIVTLTDLAQRLRPSDPVGFRAVEQRVSGALAQAPR